MKLGFQGFDSRRVGNGFDGGFITSDGGVLQLREVEARTGIIAGFAACFEDRRDCPLGGNVAVGAHEDWLAGRRYMSIDSSEMPEDFPDEFLMSADLEPECETLRTPH
ncbi:MAG TPA: hypothetical protein PLX54_02695 [Candidatus Fermentibacter daniensis]|nr:transposase [Candidatus Fermentibacter sp.]HOA05209.1 hypothetical protein [Candidatus Fermentibacter daniensis]HOD19100.1 hypothetical protein [Candidatus Fermentibacter daniensis]HOF65797.1 hypothetical protein [Candidatus Fermentibacter daniensis]HOG54359.1 hypothetical protein [Candidatus Fermentibacter daniensis]